MTYLEVRPVRLDGDCLVRAFAGDKVEAWGLYAARGDGLPMHEADYAGRGAAVEAAIAFSEPGTVFHVLYVNELDGSDTEINL